MREDYFTWHERAVVEMEREKIARLVKVMRQKITRLVFMRSMEELKRDSYPLTFPY